jgi:hypothetical protein
MDTSDSKDTASAKSRFTNTLCQMMRQPKLVRRGLFLQLADDLHIKTRNLPGYYPKR